MTDPRWSSVDEYLEQHFLPEDPAFPAALAAMEEGGLPAIAVSPMLGRTLELLARLRAPRRVLEIGTLGGYSAMWLARGLPAGGSILSLELDPHHAEVARANLARAGVTTVEIRLGPAAVSLARLEDEHVEPFDMVFIDADKEGYPDYFDASMRLGAPGTLIVIDNVVRKGEVADSSTTSSAALAVREMNERIAARDDVVTSTLQTVGRKGYDGLTLVLVTG